MQKRQPISRVGIVGSYGGLNLGDEAILQCIIAQLRDSRPVAITVFSRNVADTERRHRVDRVIGTRDLSRHELAPQIEVLNALVVGGGGILFDAEARLYLREAALAQELGVPVVVYAIGAGPLADPVVQGAVRDCLDAAAVVTVREPSARRVLEDAGVRRAIRVTADPALLLRPEPLKGDLLPPELRLTKRPLVGMSVREPGVAAPDLKEDVYHQLLANAADYIVDRFGAEVVFVPMERGLLDMQHSHAVISRMAFPQRAMVLKGEYTPGQLLGMLGRFDFAVGMRLHFLILAALAGVAFVALPYAAKVAGFLAQVGVESPPLERVNAGRLTAHIDRSWDRRRSLAQRVARVLPGLQAQARQSHCALLDVLDRVERS
jgi:polysaccharide pyruvyl transferase CsaB